MLLIGEGGLDRLSMREVARKAGVSHQAPYHHFGDREAILAAIAAEGFTKFLGDLESAAKGAGTDPAKAVEAMGRAYVGFALKHPAYFQVMFRADAVPLDKHAEARKLESAAFDRLIQLIDRAFKGEPAEARQRIAIACWALSHGLSTLLLEGRAGPQGRRAEGEAEAACRRGDRHLRRPAAAGSCRLVQAVGAVLDNLDLLGGHESAPHHGFDRGDEGGDRLLVVDDFDDEGQVLR